MRVVTVHGFNVRDKGAGTTDRLHDFIIAQGWEHNNDEADYGFFNLIAIRAFQMKQRLDVIERLVGAFEKADIIITHSNGAFFTTQALHCLPKQYRRSKIVIHISPALDADTPIPDAVHSQLVLCTKHDGWVRLSSYLFCHPWGRMGAIGYTDGDSRNTNILDNTIKGHSKWFNKANVERTWNYCYRFTMQNDFILSKHGALPT